jgi:hypothetical protein
MVRAKWFIGAGLFLLTNYSPRSILTRPGQRLSHKVAFLELKMGVKREVERLSCVTSAEDPAEGETWLDSEGWNDSW